MNLQKHSSTIIDGDKEKREKIPKCTKVPAYMFQTNKARLLFYI